MKRALPLVLLALLAFVPATASGDGCVGACNGVSVNPPGTGLLAAQPYGRGGPFVAYDTTSGRERYTLHGGLASADGRWYFTARGRNTPTTIGRYDTRTGRVVARFALQRRGWISSVSADGGYLTLTHAAMRRTAIHVLDARRRSVVRSIVLRGSWEVETVSTDGRRLFLVEYLRGGTNYRVRLYNVERGRLADRVLKGEDEPGVMAGVAVRALGSPDGRWLLTLYVVPKERAAFVHALDLRRGRPRCIFLPSGRSWDVLTRYSLTLSPDGRRLYAANPALGAVAVIDLTTRRVVDDARFAAKGVPPSKLPQTTNGALSEDGRTLYFTGARGIWAYDAAYNRVRGPYDAGRPVVGLAFGGDRVHAVRTDGRLLSFDAATGRRLRL